LASSTNIGKLKKIEKEIEKIEKIENQNLTWHLKQSYGI